MKVLYSADNSTEFEIIAEYCPNEEQDIWVEYRNTKTGQTYTARKAAFLARFSPRLIA